MGTTKLTRKEILAEDPIQQSLITIVETFRIHRKVIVIVALAALLVGAGIFYGLAYLQTQQAEAQRWVSRGITFYHATIDAEAPEDPFGKGPEPLFKSEDAKYQAASKEFSTVIAEYGSSKLGVLAQYYQGLCQMRLGQEDDALKSLELVRNNTKDRTIGYFAKKTLAQYHLNKGNGKEAQILLEGMITDPQCGLPKEVLRLELAEAYMAQGNDQEALNVLRTARDEGGNSFFLPRVLKKLEQLEAVAPPTQQDTAPTEQADPEQLDTKD